jgi:hypothetical protein
MAENAGQTRFSSGLAWVASAIAIAPMVVIYLFHMSFPPAGLRPTGFLQYDQPYYMANAREPYDSGTFPVYGLPFSPDDSTPAIYFQPGLLLLGGVTSITGWPPGVVYAVFGLLCAVIMFRLALALFEMYAGDSHGPPRTLAALSLLWGGGSVVLAGLAMEYVAPTGLPAGQRLFRFDPVEGYWLQNLGRNIFYSTEALYHALFFASVLLVLRRRYGLAIATIAATAMSSPFSGLQLLLAVAAFLVVELAIKRDSLPAWFAAGTCALLGAHLVYYLWFLNWASPEHRVLQMQWTLAWTLPVSTIVVAYGPMAALAASRFAGSGRAVEMLQDPRVRFAILWALTSLALAKHEWFTAPHQPLHFTRGYIWTPLALLAAPVLAAIYGWLLAFRARALGVALAAALCGLVLLDNAVWFGRVAYLMRHQKSWTIYLRKDLALAFERLSEPEMRGRLLISNDELAMYLATVYTPLRSWRSHEFNTPDPWRRRSEVHHFIAFGTEPQSWRSRRMVALVDTSDWIGLQYRFEAGGFAAAGWYGKYHLMIRDPK